MQVYEKVPVPLYGPGYTVMSIPEAGRVIGCERNSGPSGAGQVELRVLRPQMSTGLRSIDVRFEDVMNPVGNSWTFLGELVDPTGLPFTVWWREQDV